MLNIAIQAARAAADIILQTNRDITVETKQRSDYVTNVDRLSEAAIIDVVRSNYPDHKILAEESSRDDTTVGYRWIIDPIDGTTNFIHGLPVFSISIAVEKDGEIIIGVIYDMTRDEMFYAEHGKGAFLNGKPIQVTSLQKPEFALLATGFPFKQKHFIELYLKSFALLFQKVSAIRRLGSAAIDMAYLACGRVDGFWEIGLSPWDIAAGSLIIREAGGIISDFSGDDNYLKTGNVIASNTLLHPVLFETIRNVFKGTIDK